MALSQRAGTPLAPAGMEALVATEAATGAIGALLAHRGPVMFLQSGGCCDGSLPICLDAGELAGGDDRRGRLVLDVDGGDPEGFSIGAGPGRHFVTHARLCGPIPGRTPAAGNRAP